MCVTPSTVMVLLWSIFALAFVGLVPAVPVSVKRQAMSVATLSPTQINEFAPFTYFASTAYCHPSTTRNWGCGGAFTHCFTLEERPEVFLLKRCSRSQLQSES
jgi:hypothetical protein